MASELAQNTARGRSCRHGAQLRIIRTPRRGVATTSTSCVPIRGTMLLSIVISTSNPASTAFLNNSPFSIPAHPINGTDST